MTDLDLQLQSQRIFELEAKYLAPGTQSVALFSKLCMDRGEGAVLWDVDGNRYVDLLAGVGVESIGYAHPRYVAEMTKQLERVHVGSFTSEHRASAVLSGRRSPNATGTASTFCARRSRSRRRTTSPRSSSSRCRAPLATSSRRPATCTSCGRSRLRSVRCSSAMR